MRMTIITLLAVLSGCAASPAAMAPAPLGFTPVELPDYDSDRGIRWGLLRRRFGASV